MASRTASRHGLVATRIFALASMIAASLFLMQTSGHAQTGELDFRHYCAACHGATGNGRPTGTMNGVRPPDLTLLASKNHGRFPFAEIYEVVAGQRQITWHRRRAGMPYWHDVFYDEAKGTPDQRKAEVKERLLNIVRYVQQIQRK